MFTDLGEFYIQDSVGDADTATSDGIAVDAPFGGFAVGDAVRVAAHVDEFFGLTRLTTLTADAVAVLDCGVVTPIGPTLITLPVAVDFEPFEGMLMSFPTMTATETFDLRSDGEVGISHPDRLFIPTDIVLPGAPAGVQKDLNDRSRIVLDDLTTASNPDPIPYVGADGTLRLGETVEGLVGIVTCTFGCHKVQPMVPLTFSGSPRPSGPPDVGGKVRVATVNVLNYWTTFRDDVSTARGADDAAEFARQKAKAVAAINAMDADIIGLQELENNGSTAIDDLVAALNADLGTTAWAAIPEPTYPGGLPNAIKVGMIYRTDRIPVTPIGDPTTSLDPAFMFDRPPVAQTFSAGGEVFTVIVHHFKSKSCTNTGPSEPFPGEADIGDGQACFSPRRTAMAIATLTMVSDLQTSTGDADVLVIGDLNSYALEDPIRALRDGGLVDLTLSLGNRHTFVFFGESGQLDYAFATTELAAKITGTDLWAINTEEPRFLDYNDSNPPAAYVADEFRASDHNPMIVGLFRVPAPTTTVAPTIPETGVGDIVRVSAPAGLGLILAGLLALAGAALIGRLRREQ